MPPADQLGQLVLHERELREADVIHLRELLDERLKATALAFTIYQEETREHLRDLNHAHERSQEERGQYLDQKVFSPFLQDLTQWRQSTDRSLAKIATWGAAGLVILGIIVPLAIVWLKS